jgi:serine protease Do
MNFDNWINELPAWRWAREAGSWAVIAGLAAPLSTQASDLATLFDARSRSVVQIEYAVQREIDRQTGQMVALVVNDAGLVVSLSGSFPDWIPLDRVRDLRAYLPGNPEPDGYPTQYLGQDRVNGWHYFSVDAAAWPQMTPATDFATAVVRTGDQVWGVCLAGSNLDYMPYFRHGRIATTRPLPLMMGFATAEVASPGGPVFNHDGALVGWAGEPVAQERDLWVGQDYYRATLRSIDESYLFLMVDDFLADLGKYLPADPAGDPRPWLGVSGIQPIDKQTADFLGLQGQGALVISQVLEDSPAWQAGLRNRDVVVGVDGQPLPRFKPDGVVQLWFERLILQRQPGAGMPLQVIRGTETLDFTAVIGVAPKVLRAAERQYLAALGFTAREFLVGDALQRRTDHRQLQGVVVSFVRPNSEASTAGLESFDWIVEIDGQALTDYRSAVERLQALADDPSRRDYVLLVRRGNDTSVIRVQRTGG